MLFLVHLPFPSRSSQQHHTTGVCSFAVNLLFQQRRKRFTHFLSKPSQCLHFIPCPLPGQTHTDLSHCHLNRDVWNTVRFPGSTVKTQSCSLPRQVIFQEQACCFSWESQEGGSRAGVWVSFSLLWLCPYFSPSAPLLSVVTPFAAQLCF